MAFTIRAAELSDDAAISEVFGEGDAHHARSLPDRFRSADRQATTIASTLSDPNAALLVAKDEGAGLLVGVIRVVVKSAPAFPNMVPRTYGEIIAVVVREQHRGRGIGTALLEAAQAWAESKGASAVELNVWDFNREAIELYERLGFRQISRRMAKPVR